MSTPPRPGAIKEMLCPSQPQPARTDSGGSCSKRTAEIFFLGWRTRGRIRWLRLEHGHDADEATDDSTASANDAGRTTREDGQRRRSGGVAAAVDGHRLGGGDGRSAAGAGRRRAGVGGDSGRRGGRDRRRCGCRRRGRGSGSSRNAAAHSQSRRRDGETGYGAARADDALNGHALDGRRLRAAARAGQVAGGASHGCFSRCQA